VIADQGNPRLVNDVAVIPRGTIADDCALNRAVKKRLDTPDTESDFVTVRATVPIWPYELRDGFTAFNGATSAAGCRGFRIVPVRSVQQLLSRRKKRRLPSQQTAVADFSGHAARVPDSRMRTAKRVRLSDV